MYRTRFRCWCFLGQPFHRTEQSGMIIRAIPVPFDLPLGFDAVIIVYAKSENRDTRFTVRGEQNLLDSLAAMSPEKRMETIAILTRAVEQMLIQSTKVVRRISDANNC